MSPGLYFDEDSAHEDLLDALRANGFDVASAKTEGMLGRADETQLEFAQSLGRIVITSNVRDYQKLHTAWMQEGRTHCGIVIVTQEARLGIGERLRRFQRLEANRSADEMRDSLVYLATWLT
jgi:hypothetical protein